MWKSTRILFFLFFLLPAALRAQFVNFSMKDGLVFDNVVHLSEDDEGLIYVATNEGLNIFNGNRFLLYNQFNHPSFSNKVTSTLPVKKGFVLVGTEDKGVFLHDKFIDSLIPLRSSLADKRAGRPNVMFKDKGEIYLGASDGSVYSFSDTNINQNTFKRGRFPWKLVAKLPFSIEALIAYNGKIWIGGDDEFIYSIEKTSGSFLLEKQMRIKGAGSVLSFAAYNNRLIIGTQNGLYKLDGLPNLQSKDDIIAYSPFSLRSRIIRSMCVETKTGSLWVGTEGDGLFKVSEDGEILEHYHYSDKKRNSINSNYVLSTIIDTHNNLLLATWYGGINALDLKEKNFHFLYDKKNENDIFSNIIWCVAPAGNQKLFLGTHGNGLAQYVQGEKNFTSLKFVETSSSILSLLYDSIANRLFVGTWGHGVKVYDMVAKKEDQSYNAVFERLKDDRVYSIVKDLGNNIWIGTAKNGLFHLSGTSKKLAHVPLLKNSTESADIRIIYPIDGKIWVGSLRQGLFLVKNDENVSKPEVKHFRKFVNTGEGLSIESIYADKSRKLWLLGRNGLGYIDSSGEPNQTPLLKGNVLTGMQEDKEGNLWVASYKGIFRIDKNEHEVKGLITDHIFYDLVAAPNSSDLYASSNKGLLRLRPRGAMKNEKEDDIYIAALKVLGTVITPQEKLGGRVILPQKINYADSLVLPYSARSFTLELNTTSLSKNPKNHLQYRLKGYEKVWNNTNSTASNITYTKVPPGKYIFESRIVDENSNPLGDARILLVQIKKPWWATIWAIFTYLLVGAFIFWCILREVRQRMVMKKRLLEQKIVQEHEQALYKQKLDFFTNLAHDLRTPLTLILGPLQDVLERNSPVQIQPGKLERIYKSANMLRELVNQVLDFQKAESDAIEVQLKQIFMYDFVKSICSQFDDLAHSKNISFKVTLPPKDLIATADPVKLESVFFNLLSNSFKFTPQNGEVRLSVEMKDSDIQILVSDSGIGIPASEIDELFTRFYQARNSQFIQGSGIGMALIKKYIDLHQGSINISSVEGQGTTFTINLPIVDYISQLEIYRPRYREAQLNEEGSQNDNGSKTNKAHTVLIVEDNDELREYLQEILDEEYAVIAVDNGEEALRLAGSRAINVIICDIKMNGISGIEVCRKVKENIETSHIPFILLTANATTESQLEAFEVGADAYLEKPFNSSLLLMRVSRMIEQKEKLKIKFLKQDPLLKDINTSQVDEDFMNRLNEAVNQNIDDPDFQVQDLAKAMLISQDQLYRKVKALTELSVNQYIRHVRLAEAKKLLATQKYTVSEVVYKVGFNNASYFTKAFKKEFGVLPKEYLQIVVS